MASSPRISFIIPHKGREQMLLQTLDSLAALATPASEWEVIVVSRNDALSPELAERQTTMPLHIVFNRNDGTISYSRNLGAQHAKGEYLAFLDADVALSNNWIEEMLRCLEHPGVKLASAMQINSQDAPPLERIRTALSNADVDAFVAFLPGRNLFLHRDTFEAVGRWPEHLMTCEDYYFTDKVNQLGRLYYSSGAQYVHIGEDKAFGPMYEKEIWRGQSNLASLAGRRIPLREWPSFIVPLAIPALALLSLVLTLLDFHFLALLSLLGALAPVLAYSLRLKRLVGQSVSFWNCVLFYLVYFPARAIGTLKGALMPVATRSHA